MLFVTKVSGYDMYLDLDVSEFIEHMYRQEDVRKNTIQTYWVYQELTHLLANDLQITESILRNVLLCLTMFCNFKVD